MALLLTLLILVFFPDSGLAQSRDLPQNGNGLLSLYDPGIPPDVSVEWDFPTGFSLGIKSGYDLREGNPLLIHSEVRNRMNLIPLSFLMKYSIYETERLSQSIGYGFGPCFYSRGPMPITMANLEVTYGSTYMTEWTSPLSQDLCLNLKMTYSATGRSDVDRIPLEDFTTWLGLDVRW